MVAKAEAKYVRMSAQKIRMVIPLVKGKNAKGALALLGLVNKKGAYHLRKVLHSAVSNAKQKGYEEDKLYISKVIADGGPMLKRFRAASFGRATTILRRTAHVLVELDTPEKIVENVKTK
jgi:large subunit ribosomal protein L22